MKNPKSHHMKDDLGHYIIVDSRIILRTECWVYARKAITVAKSRPKHVCECALCSAKHFLIKDPVICEFIS